MGGGGKKLIEKHAFSLVCSGLILLICFIHAISAQCWVEFVPINGTFQNFNPVRRFFNGQVPCRDFSIYLGFGHLILGSFMTRLFGGDFAASLSAFSFLTLLAFVLYAVVLGKSILHSGKWAKAITLISLVGVFVSFLDLSSTSLLGYVIEQVRTCLSPGNSARFVRGLAPVLLVYMLYLGNVIFNKCTDNKTLSLKQNELYRLVGYSAICGLFFSYSNDYGIGSWLCFGIILGVVCFSRSRSVVRTLMAWGLYMLIGVVTTCIFVTIFTRGNLWSWLQQNFGSGGYQTWYYLSAHSHYIYDIDYAFATILQALFVLAYIYKIFIQKGSAWSCQRYGIPAVLNMTGFCVANEYKLLSGGTLREVSYTILYLTVLFESIGLLKNLLKNEMRNSYLKRGIMYLTVLVGGAWGISSMFECGTAFLNRSQGVYVADLGGYMRSLGEDLKLTKELLKDKKVFATYASALETVTDQYQPSQYDYIIHVLGDKARADYLEAFDLGEFDYVATIREDYTEWEYWIRTANWFFYRELYKDYHPVFSNAYELFWERNEPGEKYYVEGEGATLEIQKLDDGTSKIIVHCNETINGTADVTLEHHLKKNAARKNYLMWFSCINVKNTGNADKSGKDQFNLPERGRTEIPIFVKDGYGEVTITGQPNGNVELFIDDVVCNGIFTVDTMPGTVKSVHEIYEE